MADPWIKMRTNLAPDPAVVRMMSALDADKCPHRVRVVGALHALWSIADTHTEDGLLPGYTFEVVDDLIGWPGFAAAAAAAGWLEETPEGVVIPDFGAHNGASAKRRASETKRKRQARNARTVSASDADIRPHGDGTDCGLEERRGDKRENPPPERLASLVSPPTPRRGGGRRPADPISWNPEDGWTGITDADLEAWAEAYPAVDAAVALRQAGEWLRANPAKARRRAWRRFIAGWLAREQERGGGRAPRGDTGGSRHPGDWDLDRLAAAAFGESGPAKGPDPPPVRPEGIQTTTDPPRHENAVAPPSRPSNGELG